MKEIEVFIAGSKSLTGLRDSARAALVEISNKYRDLNVGFRSYTFEDFSQAVAVEGQQAEYNKYISEKADYVIFIFDEGFGEKTMEELKVAMASFKKNKKPGIYIYCNEEKVEDSSECGCVRLWCTENRQYYISYKSDNFKYELKDTFTQVLVRSSENRNGVSLAKMFPGDVSPSERSTGVKDAVKEIVDDAVLFVASPTGFMGKRCYKAAKSLWNSYKEKK